MGKSCLKKYFSGTTLEKHVLASFLINAPSHFVRINGRAEDITPREFSEPILGE